MEKKENKPDPAQSLVDCAKAWYDETDQVQIEFQEIASDCWDMIHGRIDWSHKKETDAKVHIDRVGLALQQWKAQYRQGLVNFSSWLTVTPEPGWGKPEDIITPKVAKRLVERMLFNIDPQTTLVDNIGISAVENRLATKLIPCEIESKGRGKKKKFGLKHINLNLRNFYEDLTDRDLFQIHLSEIEYFLLKRKAKDKPTKNSPWLKEAIEQLKPEGNAQSEHTQEIHEDEGKSLGRSLSNRRRVIQLMECWGTFLDEHGEVVKYKCMDGEEIECENVYFTIANGETLISEPRKFPSWSGKSPFISHVIVRRNGDKLSRSNLSFGVDMNWVEDELVCAGIDASKKEAYNIISAKLHGFADPSQADGPLEPGETYLQNDSLGPNEKLFETQPTGKFPNGLIPILNLVQGAGSNNMNLNELSLSGSLPSKQVRATEIVASGNAQSGLFESYISDVEIGYMQKYAALVFSYSLQYKNKLDDEDLDVIFAGEPEERRLAFEEASARELHDEYAGGFKFQGKGVRSLAENQRQSATLMNMLNMIVANPLLADGWERSGYDVSRIMAKVLQDNNIDMDNYRDPELAKFAKERALVREQARASAGQTQQPPGPVAPGDGQPPQAIEGGRGNGTV